MHDQFPPDHKEKNPGHSTGPRSPEGKARSSMNRLTHGCRSEQLILNHEDPAEFEFIMNGWLEAYKPEDAIAQHLVEETAKAHWFLKRNEKRLHQIEVRLPMDAWHWTETHQKLFTNFSRYKTTAERTFFRWYKALETHYRREANKKDLADAARAQAAALETQWLDKVKQKKTEPLHNPVNDPSLGGADLQVRATDVLVRPPKLRLDT
jgi:hypothetical protein